MKEQGKAKEAKVEVAGAPSDDIQLHTLYIGKDYTVHLIEFNIALH